MWSPDGETLLCSKWGKDGGDVYKETGGSEKHTVRLVCGDD